MNTNEFNKTTLFTSIVIAVVLIASGIFAYFETNTSDVLTPCYFLGVGAVITLMKLLGSVNYETTSH